MIKKIFEDSSLTAKKKAKALSKLLIDEELSVASLIVYATKQNGSGKAVCLEALEIATKSESKVATVGVLSFATRSLADDESNVKWESARVIGNIAKQFPTRLKNPINKLLPNAEHEGKVVRWATAYALAEILKLKTNHNRTLIPIIEALCASEHDDGVRKKYLVALEKVKE